MSGQFPGNEQSGAIRPEYRYVVVPRGGNLYGVRDRTNGSIVEEHLTRREARWMVWDKNGRHGSEPRPSLRGDS